MKKTYLMLVVAALLANLACEKEKTMPLPLASGDCFPLSYTYNIRPIIETSCKTQVGAGTGCHDAWIDDYSQIQAAINSGTWQNRTLSVKDMPIIPNIWSIDSLTPDELKTMQCWIEQGYPEN